MDVGILPTCWGPNFWQVIHSIAYVYNPKKDKEAYYKFFSNLGDILPCHECRIHYKENFNELEFKIALDSTEGLFRWTYDLHNKVNVQLGVKKWPTYEEVLKKYESYSTSCNEIPGVCGVSDGVAKKKLKIVEQFGDLSEDQIPFVTSTIILSVIVLFLCVYIFITRKK